MAAKEAQGIEQEAQAGLAGLVGEYLGIGQAGMVIDRQMLILPALAARFAPARVALAGPVAHCPAGDCLQSPRGGDAVADTLDPAQLLDVDMDHRTRSVLFMADDLGPGVKRG